MGSFFTRVSGCSLGICIQLNHIGGQRCLNPVKSYNDEFTIIDLNGVHEVAVDYCGCHMVQPHPIQLLRSGLYPATVLDPKMAATFQVLKFFHITMLVSKIAAHDFYTSLVWRRDNTGMGKIPVGLCCSPMPATADVDAHQNCYLAFLLMTRQWRHLKLLKRMGRNNPSSFNGSESALADAGNCAVLCPACPQPGKNLPENWREAPASQR